MFVNKEDGKTLRDFCLMDGEQKSSRIHQFKGGIKTICVCAFIVCFFVCVKKHTKVEYLFVQLVVTLANKESTRNCPEERADITAEQSDVNHNLLRLLHS